MPTYIALLRGVNVGGHRRVPMASLRELHERLGHREVITYIQSGNVVFGSDCEDPAELTRSLEAAIREQFGLAVPVILRTRAELAAAARANPYAAGGLDPARVAIAFLDRPPAADRMPALDPTGLDVTALDPSVPDPSALDPSAVDVTAHHPDELRIVGREVHLHCPNGFGRTTLTNAYLEGALGVVATTRNLKTVTRLLELSDR